MTNPTDGQIVAALQSRMESLSPQWTSKKLGIAFKPNPSAPYQVGHWMPARSGPTNAPVAFGAGAYHRLRGIFQIDLFYPKLELRTDLLFTRAAAMAAHFYPENGQGGVIDAGPGQIIFDSKPLVSTLDESDVAHNRVFVEVYARIELPPA